MSSLPQRSRVGIAEQRVRLTTASRLLESEARASRILQSIGDAVIVTDAESHVMRMNAVAETLTGWREEEAKGRPLVAQRQRQARQEHPADQQR